MTAAQHLHTAVSLAGLGLAALGRGVALVVGPLAVPPVALLGVGFGVCVLGVAYFGLGLLRGKK